MTGRVAARTIVVALETFAQVVRDSIIAPRGCRIIAQDAVMDRTTLPRVEMPNRATFVRAYSERRK